MNGQPGSPPGPILYVLKRFPRLSETFVLNEMLGLEAAGERVLVASLLPPEEGPRHTQLAELRAPVHRVPRHPRLREPTVLRQHVSLAIRRPIVWARTARRARRSGTWRRFVQAGMVASTARRERARHIHAHFATAAAEVARDAGALCDLPVTVTAHAKDIFHVENASLLRTRLDSVRAVVTVSEYNARHLRTVLPDVPVHVIGNGMPLEPLRPPVADGPVLCVARLVPKKGVDIAIRACALRAKSGDPVRLQVVGDGPLRGELTELATCLGISDLVDLVGARDSSGVAAAYEQCAMVVLACRVDENGDRDGLPTVLLEAMARGIPVITTDVVGISELVEHDQTGLLVPPDDPHALADAIARLHDEPSLANCLGSSGRARVAARHDPTQAIEHLRGVFRSAGDRS